MAWKSRFDRKEEVIRFARGERSWWKDEDTNYHRRRGIRRVHKQHINMKNANHMTLMMKIKKDKRDIIYHISYNKQDDHINNMDGTMQYNKWWTWSKKQNMTMTLIMIMATNTSEWNMQNNYDNATNTISTRQQLR